MKKEKIVLGMSGGVDSSVAAVLLQNKGFEVYGVFMKNWDDKNAICSAEDDYADALSVCNQLNIPLKKISDCTDDYLQGFDLIIVGNVVPRNSDDAKRLEALGISLTSFPQALGGLLLSNKKVVGISGTHGKTTTTYIGAQVFEQLGARPGYFSESCKEPL